MLRKRTRSIQKDQHQVCKMTISEANFESHALGSNAKSNSIFNAPLLFVGMGPKGLLDSDSVKSPTSPLDVSFFSNLSNPFRTPSSLSNEGQQRSWDCAKVGLSIIDSLEECSKFSQKILQASESKKTTLCPQIITKAPNCKPYMDMESAYASKSLPKGSCRIHCAQNGYIFPKDESTVLFEIGEAPPQHESFEKAVSVSLDSCSPIRNLSGLTCPNIDSDPENLALKHKCCPPHFIGGSHDNTQILLPAALNSNPVAAVSSNEFIKSLSASEIELSEDYTCVISHGPNPKTTHIFCDFILETHATDFKKHNKNGEEGKELSLFSVNSMYAPNHFPSSEDFLSFCHHCNKKLEEGKDIYIYRGEKAFCSLSCRAIEIMIDEELEKSDSDSSPENSPKMRI
ncbi:hypothetical protein PHAVU_001G056900 [Phaseolus vulgaris]|uniref:FLZ-type domain-containing protein n=1 Tax=Phaseolus vulgaris TaxID=3885 RepID=V7CV75_PHAVU|nr:hypothetical protein PHAVU_001G056900g [Phaseolus vulgaris]XP_007161280.1 hypothetical protein PHAVU_001G056900g [Phaseolus vulgaris]ESW33273.1 hypothetical protein PHAVU_001G056900g [Phaseolus vulgaris]ESW33274.1 hypothetical protein PHAVU_001G056900g [Phaseolus vulgaris]